MSGLEQQSELPSEVKIGLARQHVKVGLDIIRAQQYTSATRHFVNKNLAHSLGIISFRNPFGLISRPVSAEMEQHIITIGINFTYINDQKSYAQAIQNMHTLSLFTITVYDPDNRQRIAPTTNYIRRTLALLHFEAWLKMLRSLQGEPLTGTQSVDDDINEYLHNQEISLTPEFIDRVNRRSLYPPISQLPLN